MSGEILCKLRLHKWWGWRVVSKMNVPAAFGAFYGNAVVERKCARCGKKQQDVRFVK